MKLLNLSPLLNGSIMQEKGPVRWRSTLKGSRQEYALKERDPRRET